MCDLKLYAIMYGNHGCNSTNSCIFGECYRFANSKKTGGKGRWIVGGDQCIKSMRDWNDKWEADTLHDSEATKMDKLKKYMSQRFYPLDIFDESEFETPIVLLSPPPMLHLNLGMYSFVVKILLRFY